MPNDAVDSRHMLCLRRIELKCYKPAPQRNLSHTEDPDVRAFGPLAAGDIDRARRRWERANLHLRRLTELWFGAHRMMRRYREIVFLDRFPKSSLWVVSLNCFSG